MATKTSLKKERNSNIEFLRILSMMSIVIGHFNRQAQFNNYSVCLNDIIISILGQGQRVAVNIFLFIGVWYLDEAKEIGKRIINLYLHCYFYTSLITTVIVILPYEASILDIAKGFLPFLGRALWFVSAYITLILIEPYLWKVILLKKKQLTILALLLLVTVNCICTLPDNQINYISDCLWFWVAYIQIGCFKKYYFANLKSRINKWQKAGVLGVGIIMYLLLSILCHLHFSGVETESINKLGILANQYLMDIKTLPNILIAFCIFLFFILLKEKESRFVNSLSSITLGTYIFHQVPAFITVLWMDVFRADLFRNAKWSFVYLFFVVATVFLASFIIENTIWKVVNHKVSKTKVIKILQKKIDNLYDTIT